MSVNSKSKGRFVKIGLPLLPDSSSSSSSDDVQAVLPPSPQRPKDLKFDFDPTLTLKKGVIKREPSRSKEFWKPKGIVSSNEEAPIEKEVPISKESRSHGVFYGGNPDMEGIEEELVVWLRNGSSDESLKLGSSAKDFAPKKERFLLRKRQKESPVQKLIKVFESKAKEPSFSDFSRSPSSPDSSSHRSSLVFSKAKEFHKLKKDDKGNKTKKPTLPKYIITSETGEEANQLAETEKKAEILDEIQQAKPNICGEQVLYDEDLNPMALTDDDNKLSVAIVQAEEVAEVAKEVTEIAKVVADAVVVAEVTEEKFVPDCPDIEPMLQCRFNDGKGGCFKGPKCHRLHDRYKTEIPKDPLTLEIEYGVTLEDLPPKMILRKDSYFFGKVMKINSPHRFYVAPVLPACLCQSDDYDIIKKKYADVYKDCGVHVLEEMNAQLLENWYNNQLVQKDVYLAGQLIMVKLDNEGSWMVRRGIILKDSFFDHGKSKMLVHYTLIDLPMSGIIDMIYVRPLPLKYSQVPPQVYTFFLYGVIPLLAGWDEISKRKFSLMIENEIVLFNVKKEADYNVEQKEERMFFEDESPYVVKMLNYYEGSWSNDIGEELADGGFAIPWNKVHIQQEGKDVVPIQTPEPEEDKQLILTDVIKEAFVKMVIKGDPELQLL